MLILARHGQTAANAGGLLLGRADPPLTDTGRAQAVELVRAIGPVDRVVSSPLLRATETAAGFGRPVEVEARWIEIDYGELDQLPFHAVSDEVWRRWRSDPSFAPPGGESLEQLDRRVAAACEDLVADAATSDVVVVSHVSPIKAAVAWGLAVTGSIAWRMHLDVASITRLRVGSDGAALLSFNDTAHLRSPAAGRARPASS